VVSSSFLSPDPYTLLSSLPFIVLGVGALVVVALDLFVRLKSELIKTLIAIFPLLAAACLFLPSLWLDNVRTGTVSFSGQLSVDSLTGVVAILILLASAGVIVLNHGSLAAQGVEKSRDINSLFLISTIGAVGMVASNDLLTFFLSLELLSVPLYVLVGSARKQKASAEGALKYFLLGAISSAFLLYGVALLYGISGTAQIAELADRLQGDIAHHPLTLVAVAFVAFGLAFKTSLAPFHFWTPDAYQGAPLSVLAYMAVVVKVAAFGSMLRIFNLAFGSFPEEWTGLLLVLGVLSMFVGNLSALRQTSLKRLIAYSSIAHAGYAVVGLPFSEVGGVESLLFYIITYAVTSLGLIAVLLYQMGGTSRQFSDDSFDALRGLYYRNKFAAVALAVFVLSLAGIPPLAGFFGKFFVISTALRGGYPGVAVILVLNSVISLYYYLRIIGIAFSMPHKEEGEAKVVFSTLPAKLVFASMFALVVSSTFLVDSLMGPVKAASNSLTVPLLESSSY